ncbi:hypothetical protein B296_00037633, partial [Ensete ventricosum]
VRLIKELYGNQIGELFHSLSYNLIEFVLEDFDWYVPNNCSIYAYKVTVSLRYADLVSILPSRIRVLAWPVHPSKKILAVDRKESGPALAQSIPSRLSYAEDALRTMSLPEGRLYLSASTLSEHGECIIFLLAYFPFYIFSICRDSVESASGAATDVPTSWWCLSGG